MASDSLCLVLEMSKIELDTNVIVIANTRKPNNKVQLATTGAYGIVRHPAMSCLMAVFLITPTMVTYH